MLAVAATLALASGCSSTAETPDITPDTAATTEAADPYMAMAPEGLPPAVWSAARGAVSLTLRDSITQKQTKDGDVQSISRKGSPTYGSGTHIGMGRIITAHHVGSETAEPGEFGCFGQEVTATEDLGASAYMGSVDTAAANVEKYGDIALAYVNEFATGEHTAVDIAPEGKSTEQQTAYLVNYQSYGESGESDIRSPESDDPAMRTPAIFSGVAKQSPDGTTWTILANSAITKEYGSGTPTMLTPGGSGGALLNERGELLGVTTAVRDMASYNLAEVKEITQTDFDGLDPTAKYVVQHAQVISGLTVKGLEDNLSACQPDENDTLLITAS